MSVVTLSISVGPTKKPSPSTCELAAVDDHVALAAADVVDDAVARLRR